MTILGRFLERRNIENPAYPLTSQALIDMFTRTVTSGVSVDEKTAMSVPAVRRAVDLIAGTSAGLPLKTYRQNPDGSRAEVRNMVLEAPYPDVTPFVFWELVLTDLLLWGNSYTYKVRSELGGPFDIVRLLRIPPWEVTVQKGDASATNPSGKWFRVGGNEEARYTPADVMHIPALGYDGMQGLSRIGLGAEAIGVALAAERTAARLFGDGLLFAGVLTTEQSLDAAQAKGIADIFRAGLRDSGPGAKIPVIGKGTSFNKMSMAAEEAQFLESRGFQVLEVARMFGIPPPLLMADGATSNYGTGLEQQMIFFLTTTLDGWLRRVEQAASLHLTPRGQFCEYTRAALLRTNTLERYQAYAVGIQWGFLSRGDIRRLENLPVEDDALEDFLQPSNMVVAGEEPAPDAPAPPAPDPSGPPVTEGIAAGA